MSVAYAVDLGASSGRVMKVTLLDGKINIEPIYSFAEKLIEQDNHLYWDINYIVNEVEKGLLLSSPKENDSIGIDTWGVDYVLIEGSKAFCYRDGRGREYLKQVLQEKGQDWIYSRSGLQIMDINTLYQLMSEKDDISEKTLLFIPDYITWRLTNVLNTELSIASTSQLLDPYTRTWNSELVDLLNENKPKLLPVNPPGKVIGKWQNKASLISVCGHDTQSAIVAVPATEKDFLFLSCGTWSLLGTELNEPCMSQMAKEYDLTNEIGYEGRISFMKNITGLWIIQQLKSELGLSYDEMESLAESTLSITSYIDVDDPLFSSPGPMKDRIISYLLSSNQKCPKSIGELLNVVYESLAFKYKQVKQQIEECTGKKYERLYIVGGGVRSKVLCNLSANYLNIEVIRGPSEATVVGNALVQFISRGELSSLNEARQIVLSSGETEVITPNNDNEIELKYDKFLKVIKNDIQ